MSLSSEEQLRYSRHLIMGDIGEQGQRKLKEARVLIVGLGGLGCPVALYLAAAGVGELSLCDPDVIEKSNLQRQVLYRDSDAGQLKVIAAERELLALNPGIQVNKYPDRFSVEWLENIDEEYSAIVDCTDNLSARQAINTVAVKRKIPLISASALGWEGQVVAFDFTGNNSPCLNCLMPEGSEDPILNCANAGVVGPVLGTMGTLQAMTVMRVLLGFFRQHGELQRYDGKSGRWLQLTVAANAECSVCSANKK